MTEVDGPDLAGPQSEAAWNIIDRCGNVFSIAYGGYTGYYPHGDSQFSHAERKHLSSLGGYEDKEMDFKVHLNPDDNRFDEAVCRLVKLSRKSKEFREGLYQMKFWRPEVNPVEEIPGIVLYPYEGSLTNAAKIAYNAVPYLGSMGIKGNGRDRPFNMPIVEGLCYIAQGSGGDKENYPAYRSQFDPSRNHAYLRPFSDRINELVTAVSVTVAA
jgi:hypothetical protein